MLLCAKGKILLKNDKTDFTQGRILPKLAFFMLPILGALVLQAAYGAVDLLVVGRFGSTSGLSAVSTGSQVLNLVTFVVTQLAMGVTVLIARYLGEKRPQYIGQVIGGAAIVFTLLAAALFVVLVFFARLISSLMQAPAEALDLTASYVRICGSGIFFIVAYNMLSALFRGLGDSRSPLIFVLVACIVNVIGDLVLVAGFHLDAAGAAIATVAAQAVSVICAIAMLLKKELPFKIHRSDFKLNPQCKKFLGIGLPLALQEFLTQLSFLALCAFVNRLGLEASSGYGVACKIVNFAMLIPSSLIHVDLGTNIDRHNHKEIWNTLDDLKKLQLLQDKNFAWTIGRVDDRLYETNFPDIMMESEILAELQSKPLPDNVHAAFLKTCYNFADKMGLKLNLREHKQTHSYCWSTSSSSNVFYVDMNLKTYRCTCTVGRSRYSLFDFSYENLTNYRPVAVTCNSYAECKDCKIGGFCGGGCQLSHQIDFKKCCTYEEEVFSHFMKTLFIPYIKSKYNEVNQNERKAENRCT